MDNHDSHVSVKAVHFCKKNGIVFLLTIPPHTSNRLQPLDVSLFGSLRGLYKRAIDSWLAENPGKTCSLYEVAELTGKAFSLVFTPKNIQSGFARCGIYPFNRDIFTDDDFIGSYVTDRPNPETEPNKEDPKEGSQKEPNTETAVSDSVKCKISSRPCLPNVSETIEVARSTDWEPEIWDRPSTSADTRVSLPYVSSGIKQTPPKNKKNM